MVAANELRTGNWVEVIKSLTKSGYYQVNGIDISDVWKGHKSMFAPIPLTPEILIACGFKKEGDGDVLKVIYETDSFDKWDDLTLTKLTRGKYANSKDEHYYFLGGRPTTRVWYVHQLQNLYFALTQKELTINL